MSRSKELRTVFRPPVDIEERVRYNPNLSRTIGTPAVMATTGGIGTPGAIGTPAAMATPAATMVIAS